MSPAHSTMLFCHGWFAGWNDPSACPVLRRWDARRPGWITKRALMQYQFTMSARMPQHCAGRPPCRAGRGRRPPAQAEEAATAQWEPGRRDCRDRDPCGRRVGGKGSAGDVGDQYRERHAHGQGNLSDLGKFDPSLSITEARRASTSSTCAGLQPGLSSDTSDRSLVAVYLDDTPISLQGQTPDLQGL
jgi:hypothetical protein